MCRFIDRINQEQSIITRTSAHTHRCTVWKLISSHLYYLLFCHFLYLFSSTALGVNWFLKTLKPAPFLLNNNKSKMFHNSIDTMFFGSHMYKSTNNGLLQHIEITVRDDTQFIWIKLKSILFRSRNNWGIYTR